MHKLNLPPLIWPADPGALQTNVIAHPAGASLAKTGIATLSALPRQRMETMMQRHQPILMQDPCVRFLFPAEVVKKEIAFYKTKQNEYGLPLDNRATYTKLDWLIWTATLADNQKDFQAIAHYGYKFANETSTRVPLSDWYMTTDGKQKGFQARSVVGGIFIKMLADGAMWKKWASGANGF